MQNLIFDESGSIVKRGGTAAYGTNLGTSATVPWVFHAYSSTDRSLIIRFAQSGTKIRYDIAGGGWTDVTGATARTAGTYPVGCQFKNAVYVTDKTNGLKKITIANPPVHSSVTTPNSVNPAWVLEHGQRLYIGGQTGTYASYVYFSDFGTDTFQVANFLRVPDDQGPFTPQIAIPLGNSIGFFCEDCKARLSGVSMYSFRLDALPRSAPIASWRTAVNMGGYIMYLDLSGLMAWDVNGMPVSINSKINVADFDFRTPEHTWAMRVGEEYWLFYRPKGTQQPAASNFARLLVATVYAAWTRLIRIVTAAPASYTGPTHYYRFNPRTRQTTGPHDGAWLSGATELFVPNDNGEPWLGSAWAGGIVARGEQTTYTDVNASGSTEKYYCRLKSGALIPRNKAFASMDILNVNELGVMFNTVAKADHKLTLSVYFDADDVPYWNKTVKLGTKGPIRGEASSPGDVDRPQGGVAVVQPDRKDRAQGYWPVLGIEELSSYPLAIRGFYADVTEGAA